MVHSRGSDWREVTIGDERALASTDGPVTFLFGLGPRLGRLDRTRRAAALLEALQPSVGAFRWCEQVHGTELVTVPLEAADGVSCAGRGDGLLTRERGVGLVVWTADCVPVLLSGSHTVAAVHAGWRGAAAGVIRAAVHAMVRDHGEPPARIAARLGPAVSAAHYPVGPEVLEKLRSQGVPENSWRDGDRVDLCSFIAAQLGELGVERVTTVGLCTVSTPELASYRRDGTAAGRQWSCVYRSR